MNNNIKNFIEGFYIDAKGVLCFIKYHYTINRLLISREYRATTQVTQSDVKNGSVILSNYIPSTMEVNLLIERDKMRAYFLEIEQKKAKEKTLIRKEKKEQSKKIKEMIYNKLNKMNVYDIEYVKAHILIPEINTILGLNFAQYNPGDVMFIGRLLNEVRKNFGQ